MDDQRKPLSEADVDAGRRLASDIKRWGRELGFDEVAVADTDLARAEQYLQKWLAAGFHGTMDFMARHGQRRSRPQRLVPGTVRVISVRMNYLPQRIAEAERILNNQDLAYISRYALGRDYHRLMRRRLDMLARRIRSEINCLRWRAFVDSAPVLEKALAEKAGLGWIGKNSNLIDTGSGSFFFIGELYTNLALPVDRPARNHCGSCSECLTVCPTQAIVAPYQVDARRCISYLTIELRGSIPVGLRKAIGNRIFGCDDCQLVCPWNKYARVASDIAFHARNGLDATRLVDLFRWDETTFLRRTEGSAIRRTGYEGWLRNLAVAIGNGRPTTESITALNHRRSHASNVVREHVLWALQQLSDRAMAVEKNDRDNI